MVPTSDLNTIYTPRFRHAFHREPPTIVMVGCGGTGGFVAPGLCRMLPKEILIQLVDYDRVEPHNLERQNFVERELGQFKSEALAKRLATEYNRTIGYSTIPFSRKSQSQMFKGNGLLIGCVDRATGRQALSSALDSLYGWYWLDAGNAKNSGQILFGNLNNNDGPNDPHMKFRHQFSDEEKVCYALPSPSWQQPGILIPTEDEAKPKDCAERVEEGEQSPVINQFMASLVLEFVKKFFTGTLTWMALYADLDEGSMRPIPIELRTVSRITGYPRNIFLRESKNKPGA